MVGKGSVRHNERKFNAKNTDPSRTTMNTQFCNESIEKVYHELFDEALKKYNAKQKRSDRMIDNYYKKIVNGKQEKPFHEIILQIGNKDDMNAQTDEGELAEKILKEYMEGFRERNPYLRVFSAHLHMDEATPHLHIDFVPFITGSKRGLETRVSLKQALAKQGFTGGSRGDTEWNQWVRAEKEELAVIMEKYGIEWEQLGTHEKHLSVLDYEKKMRSRELEEIKEELGESQEKLKKVKESLDLFEDGNVIESYMKKLEDEEYKLPEPTPLMTSKAYKTKSAEPVVAKLTSLIRSIYAKYVKVFYEKIEAKNNTWKLEVEVAELSKENRKLREVNSSLLRQVKEYSLLERVLGKDKLKELVEQAKSKVRNRNRNENERIR